MGDYQIEMMTVVERETLNLRVVDSSKSRASMLRTRGTHAGTTEVKFLFARGAQGRGFEHESGVNVKNSRHARRYNRSQVLVCTRDSGSWIRAIVGRQC